MDDTAEDVPITDKPEEEVNDINLEDDTTTPMTFSSPITGADSAEQKESGDSIRERPERSSGIRKIEIQRSEERKGSFSKYLVYIISCDPKPKGVVTVARRYSDFIWLRQALTKAFSALWIPPLPPKKMFGRYDQDFVEGRRQDLERFLNRVEEIPALGESKAMAMFLSRPETTFKSGCTEIEETMKEDTVTTKTYLFQKMFPDLHEDNLPATASIDIERLKEFLTKCKEQLEGLLESCRTALGKYDTCSEEVHQLSETFKELYQTETNYPYRPTPDRYDVRKQFAQWETFTRQQTDLFELKFLRVVQYEYQDIVAFLELMDRRDSLDSSYTKVNVKCENWRATGDAELNPKQKTAKEADLTEEKELLDFLEISNKICLQNEITKVWDEKIQAFEKAMLEFSQSQLKQTETIAGIWKQAVPEIEV